MNHSVLPRRSLPACMLLLGCVAVTPSALGQEAQPPAIALSNPLSRSSPQGPIGVLQRSRPEYDSTGLRVGTFIVTPLLFSSLGYDDNVFATNANRRSDGVFRIAPTALVRSDWSRHAFVGEAAVENVTYFNSSRLSGVNARVLAAGRIDVDSRSTINLNANFSRSVDGSLSPTSITPGLTTPSINSLTPAITNRYSVGASYSYVFNRLVITPSVNYQRFTYESLPNVALGQDQSQRDGNIYTIANRISYRLSGPSSAFVEAAGNFRRYRNPLLDSEGLRVSGGVATDFFRLFQGEVQAGILHQIYAPGRGSVTSPFLSANLRYFPTERITLGLFARRDVGEPSAINVRPGITTLVGITGEFELRRNILFTTNYTFANIDSRGNSDSLHNISGGPVLLINRHAQLSAIYRHQRRDNSTSNFDYDRNQFLVQLRLGL